MSKPSSRELASRPITCCFNSTKRAPPMATRNGTSGGTERRARYSSIIDTGLLLKESVGRLARRMCLITAAPSASEKCLRSWPAPLCPRKASGTIPWAEVLRKQRGTLTAREAGRVQEGWCCFHSSIFATPFIDSDQRLSFFGICLQYPRFLVPKWLPKHVGGEVTQRVGMGEATQSLD